MPFGNEKDQTKCSPKDNNYCGGFALDAVLTDLGISGEPNPKKTYDEIQVQQNVSLVSGSVSDGFIKSTMTNGTAMSLPSSIALTAQGKGLNVTVIINETRLSGELGKDGARLVAEEKGKLGGIVKDVKDIFSAAERSAASHFIVLVDNAHHWVAVKKGRTGSYTCYNPSGGKCVTGSGLTEAVNAGISGSMNSLIIALRQ